MATAPEELRQAEHPLQPLHSLGPRIISSEPRHQGVHEDGLHQPRQAIEPQLPRGGRLDQEDPHQPRLGAGGFSVLTETLQAIPQLF